MKNAAAGPREDQRAKDKSIDHSDNRHFTEKDKP
jgi:hypothetical protein